MKKIFVSIFILFKFRMLEKEEKQVSEECSRPRQAAATEANSPSILEGVPSGGVVILNIRIPCENDHHQRHQNQRPLRPQSPRKQGFAVLCPEESQGRQHGRDRVLETSAQ